MYNEPQNSAISEDRSSSRKLIITIVAVLLFGCCCLVTGVGGYYGYQAYVAAKEVVDQAKEIYEIPVNPDDPNSPNVPIPFTPFSEAPKGGLGDERAREFVWHRFLFIIKKQIAPLPKRIRLKSQWSPSLMPKAHGRKNGKWIAAMAPSILLS